MLIICWCGDRQHSMGERNRGKFRKRSSNTIDRTLLPDLLPNRQLIITILSNHPSNNPSRIPASAVWAQATAKGPCRPFTTRRSRQQTVQSQVIQECGVHGKSLAVTSFFGKAAERHFVSVEKFQKPIDLTELAWFRLWLNRRYVLMHLTPQSLGGAQRKMVRRREGRK